MRSCEIALGVFLSMENVVRQVVSNGILICVHQFVSRLCVIMARRRLHFGDDDVLFESDTKSGS